MWWQEMCMPPPIFTHTHTHTWGEGGGICRCVLCCLCWQEMYSLLPVLPEWLCICDGEWWCYMPPFWHTCGPRAGHVFTWQHNMWYNICSILQVRSPPAGWLWWFQLQCMGLHEDRACRFAFLYEIITFWKTTAYLLPFRLMKSNNKWGESVWEWRFSYPELVWV